MFVITMQMHLIGVNNLNMSLLFFLLSSMLWAEKIVIHEINKIDNITLSNGSSITQGGLTIVRDKALISQNGSVDNNRTISQGVILIDDKNITDVHYDIINIINGYPITED